MDEGVWYGFDFVKHKDVQLLHEFLLLNGSFARIDWIKAQTGLRRGCIAAIANNVKTTFELSLDGGSHFVRLIDLNLPSGSSISAVGRGSVMHALPEGHSTSAIAAVPEGLAHAGDDQRWPAIRAGWTDKKGAEHQHDPHSSATTVGRGSVKRALADRLSTPLATAPKWPRALALKKAAESFQGDPVSERNKQFRGTLGQALQTANLDLSALRFPLSNTDTDPLESRLQLGQEVRAEIIHMAGPASAGVEALSTVDGASSSSCARTSSPMQPSTNMNSQSGKCASSAVHNKAVGTFV